MAERSLDSVRDRLEQAVSRLEAVDTGKAGAAASSGLGTAAVSKEIKSLRAENAALQDVTRTVSTRLDSAIGRIRDILDA